MTAISSGTVDAEALEVHPAAHPFPRLDGPELEALERDIAAHGLREPIALLGGQILDGRNRLAACLRTGTPPRFEDVQTDDPLAFVVSRNLRRRHLTAGQRAVLALELEERFSVEAKGRQGTRTDLAGNIPVLVPECSAPERESRSRAADVVGASASNVSKAKRLALVAPDLLEEVRAGTRTLPEAARELRRRDKQQVALRIASEPPPLPTGPFRVIVADPPWEYHKRANDPSQRGQTPYPTMSLDQIRALPVADLAYTDSLLWLWTTNSHLEEAFGVVRAWDFTPKTVLTWTKNRIGTGDWLRGQSEHCILAARGQPVVTLSNQSTVLQAPVGEHSSKPDAFFDLVESLCPGSKVELFARQRREGWHSWGGELPPTEDDREKEPVQ